MNVIFSLVIIHGVICAVQHSFFLPGPVLYRMCVREMFLKGAWSVECLTAVLLYLAGLKGKTAGMEKQEMMKLVLFDLHVIYFCLCDWIVTDRIF